MNIRYKRLIVLSSMGLLFILQLLYWQTSLVNNIISILMMSIAIESCLGIRRRYQRLGMFDRANLPSISNKNPISGNMIHLIVKNNFCKILFDYHKKLGRTIGFFFGPDPWIMTTDLDLLHQVYVKDYYIHVDLPNFRLPYDVFRRSIPQLTGNKWRKVRRSFDPLFTHKQIYSASITENLEDSSLKLLNSISSHPIESGQETDGRIIDVQHTFINYTVDGVSKIFLEREDGVNMKLGEKDKLVKAAIEGLKYFVNLPTYLSVALDFLQPFADFLVKFTCAGRSIAISSSFIDESFRMREESVVGRKALEGDLPIRSKRIIDTLIRCKSDEKMKNLELDPTSIAWFMYAAGFDTTATTLTTLFWLLSKHQDVQEKLRQALIHEGEEATYLDWCLKETLRLYPSGPIAVRLLGDDVTTSEGSKLTKGMALAADIYSIHHDPEYWGADVEEFRPERFAEPLKHPNQFFAFGAGPRGCLGQHLARRNSKMAITQILPRYRVEPCPSTPQNLPWNAKNLLDISIEGLIDLKFIEVKPDV